MAGVNLRAANAGSARGLDLLADAIGSAVDQAAGVLHRLAVRVVEEVGRQGGAGGGRTRGDVQHGGHRHRALVARAAEAGDGLLVAAGDRWRARLLQADDVASEAEAEVAGIVTRYLLGGHVQLAGVAAGTGSKTSSSSYSSSYSGAWP